jgi:hypothetical protein
MIIIQLFMQVTFLNRILQITPIIGIAFTLVLLGISWFGKGKTTSRKSINIQLMFAITVSFMVNAINNYVSNIPCYVNHVLSFYSLYTVAITTCVIIINTFISITNPNLLHSKRKQFRNVSFLICMIIPILISVQYIILNRHYYNTTTNDYVQCYLMNHLLHKITCCVVYATLFAFFVVLCWIMCNYQYYMEYYMCGSKIVKFVLTEYVYITFAYVLVMLFNCNELIPSYVYSTNRETLLKMMLIVREMYLILYIAIFTIDKRMIKEIKRMFNTSSRNSSAIYSRSESEDSNFKKDISISSSDI